ncbi:MAG: transposase [Planctomycetia bacterium]|nr:transposase [Planctomycetia bacterium]
MFQTTLWTFRIGPGTDSERRHLGAMFSMLPTGSLLTADAGFISYELCAELLRRSVHFVLRVGGNITLLTEVGGTHEVVGETVYLWPAKR